MTIYLDIDPPRVTAQQKGETIRGGRIQHYTKRRVQEARDLMGMELMRQAPPEPLEGPVRLEAVWVFSRSRKLKAKPEWKITRPDTDNLIKLLKDVMTDCGYWRDDAQVCREVCAKLWESVEVPRGIYIEVERMEDTEWLRHLCSTAGRSTSVSSAADTTTGRRRDTACAGGAWYSRISGIGGMHGLPAAGARLT